MSIEPIKPPVRAAGEGNAVTRWFINARGFFAEVRNEMRRVTWPSRKEVYATTFVVVLTAMFFGLYLYGIDLLLTRIVNWIYSLAGVA